MSSLKPALLSFAVVICVLSVQAQTADDQPPGMAASKSSLPTPAQGSFAQERELLQKGKYDEAITELGKLESQTPRPKGLSHEFGVAYYKKGGYILAIDYFKAALQENPEDNEATQLLGLSDYLAGRPADAIPLLLKVQSWYPVANLDASYILGICYIQTKNYPEARRAFARMFNVPAESASSYLFTARMLLRQEFEPIAQEYAKKAVELDPHLPLAHFLLGEIYMFESRIPESIGEFQKELQINPGHAATYYKLADAYSRIQKYEDAERLLQQSIWLDATSTGPYILMGKVLEKKGEPELAKRALEHAMAMDPNNPITHHLLGQVYRDMGMSDDAARELKAAEQLQRAQNASQ